MQSKLFFPVIASITVVLTIVIFFSLTALLTMVSEELCHVALLEMKNSH